MTCRVCGGQGMVRAAPVLEFYVNREPRHPYESRTDWTCSVIVPCWACHMKHLRVIT